MNSKTLLYIILIFSLSLTFIVGGIYTILQIDPTILGFPPIKDDLEKSDSIAADLSELEKTNGMKYDTVFIEPKITLSANEFEKYESEALKKDILEYEKDSLKKLKMSLLDSINSIHSSYGHIRDSFKIVKDTMLSSKRQSKALDDSLKKYLALYKETGEKLKQTEEKLQVSNEALTGQYDTLEYENFENYAEIYNNSSPEKVAKILANLDPVDASTILRLMKKRKAGKVLDAMAPEEAAAILKKGIDKKAAMP